MVYNKKDIKRRIDVVLVNYYLTLHKTPVYKVENPA